MLVPVQFFSWRAVDLGGFCSCCLQCLKVCTIIYAFTIGVSHGGGVSRQSSRSRFGVTVSRIKHGKEKRGAMLFFYCSGHCHDPWVTCVMPQNSSHVLLFLRAHRSVVFKITWPQKQLALSARWLFVWHRLMTWERATPPKTACRRGKSKYPNTHRRSDRLLQGSLWRLHPAVFFLGRTYQSWNLSHKI